MSDYREMTQGEFDLLHHYMEKFLKLNMPNAEAHEVTDLFNLHNIVLPFEGGRSCSSCRARVFEALKTFYHNNKQKYGYDI